MEQNRKEWRLCIVTYNKKKLPLRHSSRWKDNIKINREEIEWDYFEWIHLAPKRYEVGCCVYGNKSLEFLDFLRTWM